MSFIFPESSLFIWCTGRLTTSLTPRWRRSCWEILWSTQWRMGRRSTWCAETLRRDRNAVPSSTGSIHRPTATCWSQICRVNNQLILPCVAHHDINSMRRMWIRILQGVMHKHFITTNFLFYVQVWVWNWQMLGLPPVKKGKF